MSKTPLSFSQVFASLKQKGEIALMPFIPAGYPDLQTTAELLPALERGGANAIEIGIPFSDPIADGPIIQDAFTQALANKITVADVFKTVKEARKNVSIPLAAMVSYSIVFRYGNERFFNDAKEAGFNGLIIPDLPPPEIQEVAPMIREKGLDSILLVSPSSTHTRREQITQLCSGFVYYLSVAGTTGERDQLPSDLQTNIRDLKQITPLPVCVGFGVSKKQHVQQLKGLADGAILGSAVVRKINEAIPHGRAQIIKAAEDFCRELSGK